MTRVQALAAGRRGGKVALPIDVASPYFAHLRLRAQGRAGEPPREQDVLIGRRGLIDRAAGVQIVDWRDAPVSQVYYRYDEGDDYDEEVAGGTLRGVVEARRNVTIAGGKLRRIGCPQGTFVASGEGDWFELYGDEVALLAGGQGTAARPPRPGPPQRGRRRMEPARAATDANKALPEIAALIDRAQFDLITEPGDRAGRHPGRRRLGQDDGGAAPHRLPGVQRRAALQAVALPVRGAVRGAGALRRRRPARARRAGRAGHHLPQLGAQPAQAPGAVGARSLRRGHAGVGRAPQEAPGAAGAGRARGRRGAAGGAAPARRAARRRRRRGLGARGVGLQREQAGGGAGARDTAAGRARRHGSAGRDGARGRAGAAQGRVAPARRAPHPVRAVHRPGPPGAAARRGGPRAGGRPGARRAGALVYGAARGGDAARARRHRRGPARSRSTACRSRTVRAKAGRARGSTKRTTRSSCGCTRSCTAS